MEIKGIKYISPAFDGSGYAQASRSYIIALYKLGVPITLSPISFEKTLPDLGEEGKILRSIVDNDIDYNVVIVHTTPEFWSRFVELGKTMIGYTVWETTKLHKDWPGYINDSVEMVLCPCNWNKEVFIECGVTKPIGIVPHIINVDEYKDVEPYVVGGVGKDVYKFYSIFQFTERKNPGSLLRSFWSAFHDCEKVALIIKTYKNSFSMEEKESTKAEIVKMRDRTPVNHRPPVYLVLDLLSKDQVLGLHKFGDCFVSLDRGEGFGLGGFEAGAAGNPIIITGFGGALEYAKSDNSFLVNYTKTPVYNMPWSPWYSCDQMWAEPDCEHAIKLMREAYESRESAAEKGKKLQKYIDDTFNWRVVGEKMINEIKSI